MIEVELYKIYDLLLEHFGHQHWWPGETQFEIMLGAILTQNTNWTNVEKAITNIRQAGKLNAQKLYEIDNTELADLIRPAGYFRLKTKRLKNLLTWLFENYSGQIQQLDSAPTDLLRQQLLGISGIGPETADSILLYALHRPVFVVDTYTARICVRHKLIEPPLDYHQLQELFENNLEKDTKFFNEYHALVVETGKNFCKPKPKCKGCPLESLPHQIEQQL